MNGQEISKLAREYAKELYPEEYELSQEDENSPAYNSWAVDVIENCEADFICHLRFILRDHCIVKKEKVIMEIKVAQNELNEPSKPMLKFTLGYVLGLLHNLFGTDLFKERSEV